jgi:NAD(P)-dependent dehydrogenase (short-subunit alcohol dehydrogenase family)
MKLQDKVAIVTGSGRGIGRAIARRFAAEGAAVLVTARTAAECDAVAAEVHAAAQSAGAGSQGSGAQGTKGAGGARAGAATGGTQGGRAVALAADVSQAADCERIVAAARQHLGRVDILVNNAGIYGPVKPIEEIAPEEWDATQAVNLRSAFLLMRLVLPEMYARRSGVILNIASISAKAAFPWGGAYAASKAGMLGLTRIAAAEAARQGVRVNAICPGPVFETRMSKDLGAELSRRMGMDNEQQKADFIDGVLQGRAQTADEIAAAALFLASDEASAITGQSLNVDGGTVFC